MVLCVRKWGIPWEHARTNARVIITHVPLLEKRKHGMEVEDQGGGLEHEKERYSCTYYSRVQGKSI